MCECCTPKEHLGHLHIGELNGTDINALNDFVKKLPGVFRAAPDDHGDAEAVIIYDKRILSEEQLKNSLKEKGLIR